MFDGENGENDVATLKESCRRRNDKHLDSISGHNVGLAEKAGSSPVFCRPTSR